MFDKIIDAWRNRRDQGSLKSFKENQESEEAFDARDLGIHDVDLDKIVGSVGRYHDFDNQFRLKTGLPPERLTAVKEAIKSGKSLPPVKLYQIKSEYYILDGNHRVAAAKELGWTSIRAHILEFLPSQNTLENILYSEKSNFIEKTGITEPIELTEVGQYGYLIEQINTHKASLEGVNKKEISLQDAAKDWYETIYCPFIAIIERSRLVEAFPRRTLADLFAYVSFHQWEKGRARTYGIGLDQIIPKNMEEFRARMTQKRAFDFPEMKRLITAFVFINVKIGEEYKVMDRLFKLNEVEEVYDVPGEFDLLVKIVIERDWLSSDSEVVGYFVYKHIRKIPGVDKTQTLIPVLSKRKIPFFPH